MVPEGEDWHGHKVRWVRFGTGHYVCACIIWKPLAGANSGGRANRCTLHRSALPCTPCPPAPMIPGPNTPTRGWCLGPGRPASWPPSLGRHPVAAAADPVEAPTAASNFLLAMGSCMPKGVQNSTRYVCMCVCLHVFFGRFLLKLLV